MVGVVRSGSNTFVAVLAAAILGPGCSSPRNTLETTVVADAAGLDLPRSTVSDAQAAESPGTSVNPGMAVPDAANPGLPDAPARSDASTSVTPPPPPPICHEGAHLCGGACEPENAQSCGPACMVCPQTPNTEASCTAGKCVLRCRPGFGACGSETAETTGCLSDLQASNTNCGKCGRVCEGQQRCSDGICPAVKVASGLDVNDDAAQTSSFDGSELFYVGQPTGIKAIAKTGGKPRVVTDKFVFDLGVVGNSVVYSAQSPPQSPTYEIVRMPTTGGAGRRLALLDDPAYRFGQAGDFIYWWSLNQDSKSFEIGRANVAGGSADTVIKGLLPQSGSQQTIFDADGAFWQEDGLPGEIRRSSVNTPGSTTFYASNGVKSLLTADADYVYWTEGGKVVRGRKGASIIAPEIIADADGFQTYGINATINGDDLFLFAFNETIAVVPRAGGRLRMLVAPNQDTRWQIATGVDDRYVYWIGKGGTLWRVQR
jgi:hypothetical protein